ncbi:hypothetical protein RHECIAT_CH0001167 [Rhizobium etli CIAT 652]|uniref:Uncharacterized protein n=1 Tax=Rhizobium etli (strain CIAT 652) TaxID=491916 RepID=B3PSY2_RHIE6|nr:hypothetical protein RHECIAT_CH0001167 [Rhizobium etli CIAT 652]
MSVNDKRAGRQQRNPQPTRQGEGWQQQHRSLDAEKIDPGATASMSRRISRCRPAALENILTAIREQEQRHELKGSTGPYSRNRKACRGRRCGRLS